MSPDGKTITFVRRAKDERRQALMAMDSDGSHLRRLTPFTDEVAIKHDWSPDGTRIVITTDADWVRPKQSANVVTIAPDGSARRRLTHYAGGEKGFNGFVGSFSPDGTQIVLRVEKSMVGGLAVMDTDGRNLHMITKRTDPRPRNIDWGPLS
jgi:Tol biopolymer transport system component